MPNDFFETEVERAYQSIKNGQVILYPTDTVWGIGCDASQADSIQRIYRIKERDEKKSMIILLSSIKEIIQYVAAPDPKAYDFIEEQTRPVTIIFENAINLPDNLVSENGSIAIRVTKDLFCTSLIRRLKKPIVSTSANISGQPSVSDFSMISDQVRQRVDHIVQWRADETNHASPSMIVQWMQNGTYNVIRP